MADRYAVTYDSNGVASVSVALDGKMFPGPIAAVGYLESLGWSRREAVQYLNSIRDEA